MYGYQHYNVLLIGCIRNLHFIYIARIILIAYDCRLMIAFIPMMAHIACDY